MSTPPNIPYTVYVVHELRHSPEAELRALVAFFKAAGGSWQRLQSSDLYEALALHRGDHDVPCGLTEEDVRAPYSPLDLNVAFFKREMQRGRAIYQWTIEGCTRMEDAHRDLLPEEEWVGGRPTYEEDGPWLSVSEVCDEKDVESPAVYRAVDTGILDGLRHGGLLYVAPNDKLDAWSPSRRSSSLVKRYQRFIARILRTREPDSLDDLYGEAEAMAVSTHGTMNAVDLHDLFERVWGDEAPQSVSDWINRLED